MSLSLKSTAIAAATLALTVSSCATSQSVFGGGGGPVTTQQKIARCVALVGGGAILGGVIGNNTGDGDGTKGATTGAIIGGGACAVWLLMDNSRNRQRYASAQQYAAVKGTPYTDNWRDAESNQSLGVNVTPTSAIQMRSASGGPVQTCRRLNTVASAGGTSDTATEVWCAAGDGTWAPATTTMVPA